MTPEVMQGCVAVAGSLHFCQLPAMWLFRRHVIALGPELDKLSPIARRIVVVLSAAVVLTVTGTGVVVIVGSWELARGGSLALWLCGFLSVFWWFRVACQLWYASQWPQTLAGRITHRLLLSVLFAKAALYAAVAAASY